MWVFPLAAAIVAVAFAALVAKEFAARRRPYLAAWAVALLMFAAASFAAFLGILNGWTPAEFGIYWLLGAVLNVPYLALGELLLLIRDRRVQIALFLVILFGTAYALNVVRTADLSLALYARDLPLGKDVFTPCWGPFAIACVGTVPSGPGPAYRLAQYFSYPAYVVLVAGAAWSAWRMRKAPHLRNRFLGTVGIAVGATIVAIGSGVGAGLDVVPMFSVGLALGIAVMFWGFLRASRPAPARDATAST
ncbi:MAG: hypothetical protein ACJ77A_03950 [Actinomycetota bacterium]